MTRKAPPSGAALDSALAAQIECEGELDLLRDRLAEEREKLDQANEAARAAGLALARSGSDADRASAREALALKAEVERTISHLTETLIPEAQAGAVRAEENLAQARRTACADEAEAECEAVARRLAAEYPELIGRITDLKGVVAAADAKRAAANRDLPEGRRPLAPVEARVRDIPGRDAGEVAREIVSVWCYAGTMTPVPEDRVADIIQTSRDRQTGASNHVLPARSSYGHQHGVEVKRLLRVTMGDRLLPIRGPRIADMVIPPLTPSASAGRQWVELRPLAEGDDPEAGE